MATITKNGNFNVTPTELSIARRTTGGSDMIYVVQGGLGGTIDGGGGSDHLVLDQTAPYTFNFNPGSSFTSLAGIEIVSLGTKVAATPTVPSTAGTTAHNINASGYTNGLTINGNNGANTITGTAFNDIISGGGGTDSLNGGEGSDTYIYATLLDFDAEKSAGLNDTGTSGTDTVSISATSGTFTLAAFANGIEAYTITGATGTAGINASASLTGLTLTGGGGANAITGTNFADTISGGGGADDLKGGGGDDAFLYALATDFAAGEKIDGGAGTNDTILISAPSGLITLSNAVIGVERVTLTGTGNSEVSAAAVLNGLNIAGNDGNNKITGTSSADTITGGLGNDTITAGSGVDNLDGGEGSDIYVVSVFTDFLGDTTNDTGTSGTDTVSITATTGTLTLSAALNGIEAYTIAGAGAASIDASLVTTGLTLTGSTGINTLTGTGVDDVIVGGGGKDILNGGAGSDIFDYTLIADYASESIEGGLGTDTIRFSGTTGTLVLGNTLSNVEQVLLAGSSAIGVDAKAVILGGGLDITGNDGNNTITGTNFDEIIDGRGGNDTITGGTGADTLLGGLGNDTFIVTLGSEHGAGETINGQEGTDTISFIGGTAAAASIDRTLLLTAGDDVENIVMATPTGTVILNVDASAMTTTGHGVSITGNAGGNTIVGSAFADTISGGAGNDVLGGGDGDDVFLYATQAEYTGDALTGGAGTDTLRYTATAAGTFTLANNLNGVEAVALSNAAGSLAGTVALGVDASLVTSALTIYGNAGANAIRGGQAADTLDGGSGNDIFLIKDALHHGLGEVITGGAGTDEIRFDATVADSTLTLRSGVGATVERAVIGTGTAAAAVTTATTALNIDASAVTGGITLIGNNGANILVGGTGNDVLDGGVGNDLLDGGEGSDTYLYGSTTNYGIEESISDFGTSGIDTIQISAASGSLTLRDDTTGIEQVVITGAAAGVDATAVLNALSFSGGSGANVIKGTAFADVFTGGAGADNMSGNGGNDVFILNTAAEGTGDVITGGDGYDTVRFLGTGATPTTNTLTVAATTNVEEIEISDAAGSNAGTAALNINAAAVTASGVKFTGNAGANTITGGSGADIIEGGAGNDTLSGGGGNDIFLVGNGADHVTGEKIDGGAGTADVVRFTSTTGSDTLTLLANTVGIESVAISDAAGLTTGTTAVNVNASAVTTALTITGNDGANTITGTNAADTINAGGGDDIIIVSTAASHGAAEAINGGADTDTIRYTSTTAGETLTTTGLAEMENIVIGTAGGVTTGTTALNVDASNSGSALTITGNDGVNTLTGSSFADTLAGNAGNDSLVGGGGNDTLDGGADSDIMNGGEGDDSFRDVNTGDQIYGGAGNDALSASTAMPDFNLTDLDIGGATTVNLVERIDLTGVGANVLLTFVAADIEAIVGAGGTLVIDANSGDELFSVEDWGSGVVEGAYTRYSKDGVDILVTSDVGFGKTFIGTAGTDNFVGSNSPDTFLFTAATLNNADTLDGGVNTSPPDRIIITGGGLVDFLASTATITGIEVIQIGDNLDTQLVLRNGAITVNSVTGFGNGNNTITLGNGSEAQSVTTGTGNDTININILGGADEAMFTLAAGGGNDTLAISGGGSLDMTDFAGVSGFESVSIDGTATTFTANDDNLAITAGNGGNVITLGSGTQSVTSGSGADTINLGSGINVVNTGGGADTVNNALSTGDAIELDAGNDVYTLNASSTGGTVSGGTGGSDTLTIGLVGTTTATIALGEGANATIINVAYSNFDNLAAGASDDALTVTAAAGGSTIDTGSAGDNVTAGAGTDAINTGEGNDAVNITSGSYSSDTLDGGDDTDTLFITGGNTVDISTGVTVVNFEEVDIDGTATTFKANNLDLAITAGNGDNTITLGGGSGSVTTGAGIDTINLGTGDNVVNTNGGADIVNLGTGGGDDINTGGGSDTVNGTVEVGDVVDLDADSDTFVYQALGGDVRGGAGTDTITVLADAGVVSLNLNAVSGNGNYSGFENISASGANGAITATAVTSGGSTITTGTANDNVTTGGGADSISTGAGDDTVSITSTTYANDTLAGGTGGETGGDTLAITGGGAVNISTGVTISGFEKVSINNALATTFTANDDALAITVSGGSANANITLGDTGTQNVTITGTGADTVTLGSGNNNVNTGGGADTVTGDVAAGDLVNLDADNDSFEYRAITGDVRGGAGTDTITVLADAGPVSLDLNVGTGNGNYSGFENISASGANGVITATALAAGSTITTGTANDNVTAGGAADSISTGDGDDTVRITAGSYANDTLTGGNNTGTGDTLAITGGGAVDLSVGVTVSGFEKVTIDNSVANVFTAHDAALAITVSGGSVGANITLGDGFAQSVTISGTGNDTVTGGSGVNSINTGDGSDTVSNVGASDVVDLGDGNDTFVYQDLVGTTDVRGGAGTDTITYGGAGSVTIDLSATANPGNYSGFENVTVTGTGSASIIASTGGSTIATGDGIDVLTTGVGIDNFNTGAGNDTINITSLTYQNDTLNGGNDTDTLAITGGDTVNMTLANITNFENVSIDGTATTFTANNLNLGIIAGGGGNTITLGSGTQSVTISGAGNDTVTLGGGTNNVNTGGGSDSVTGTVGAGDTIDLGAGTDSYAFQTLATGTSVSGGDDSDTLIYSGSDDQVIDFLTTGDNIAAQDGIYSNFENLTATASAGFLNVTAAAAGGTINTGTGNDTITLGAGIDLVNTGAGADTVFGSVGAGDSINLAGADDIFAYQTLVAGATVDGGTSTDTLTYAGSDTLTIDFTTTSNNIDLGVGFGIYRNFENLLAGSATGHLTVTASTGGSTIVTGAGNDNITMGTGTDTISTGGGVDMVTGTLSAGESINLGDDNDNYGYQATTDAANVINADAGTGDNLTYGGSASLDIDFSDANNNIDAEPGFYRNFENFLAGSATGNYIVTAADTGSVIETGIGTDAIHLNDNDDADTVDAGGASDTVDGIDSGDDVDLGADADTAVFSTVAGATISGGTGGTDSDTLQIDATTAPMTIDLNAVGQQVTGAASTWQEFENLDADAVGVDDNLTVTANAGGSVITTGSGNDVVTLALNTNADNVTLGAGSDTIINIGDNDTINLGDGDDTATYTTAVAATINGGESDETNGDTLNLTTANAMTLNLSLVGTNQVTAGGVASSWQNFENLSAGGSAHALTVTADSVGSVITTGSGNDSVTTGASTVRFDNIVTGTGDDTVNITSSTYANDTLDGGGNTGTGDTLAITGGNTVNMTLAMITNFEKVTINDTATIFTANNDNLAITAGDGGNTINLGSGTQSVTSGSGNDTITLGASTQSVTAGAGDDIIVATDALLNSANMTLAGGAHTSGDTLRVTDDASLDDADFTNMSGIEVLQLQGTGVQNVTLGLEAQQAGIVTVTAGDGGANIQASGYTTAAIAITTGNGKAYIVGGAGNDTLSGAAGNDYFEGGAGNDTLGGGAGNDLLDGGGGADALTGGADDDVYAFDTGDVASGESITEAASGGTDTLLAWSDTDFSNLAAADFDEIERIVINDGGTATFTGAQLAGETIAINEWWWGGGDVTNLVVNVNDLGQATQDFSNLTFAAFDTYYDNLLWSAWWWHGEFQDGADTVTINASGASQSIIGTTISDTINGTTNAGAGDILDGNAGNDTISGFAGNDTLTGGAGTDDVSGDAGDDVYLVADSAHHGSAEFTDSAGTADEVRFTSTTGGQTLTLYAGDTGLEKVTIGTSAGVTTGTTALDVDASAVLNALTITGNDGANSLTGTVFNDTIVGNAGNDTITGGVGSDNLSGDDGSDTFIVGAVADFTFTETVNGGANASGVDTLRLNDADTYGNTVLDGDLSGIEVVSLNQDGAWSLTFADAAYANADANGDGTADGTITVSAVNTLTNGVTVVAGTTTSTHELVVDGANLGGNDTITAGGGNDTIGTGDGDDKVNITSATYANDTLTGGANTDTLAITGGGIVNIGTGATVTGFDVVTIDNSAAGNVFTANTDDLDIQVSGGNEAVTINLGATGAQDVTISGGTGNDIVNLGGGENHIDTGDGSDSVLGILSANDTVDLGDGNDTYAYSLTALGNLIDGGAGNDTLTYSGGAETFDFFTTNDNIATEANRYQNFESLSAADATGALDVTAAAAGSTITTGTGSYDDLVTLGAGVDIVNTGGGSDTVAGGVGTSDQVNLGAGDDTFIYEDLTLGGSVNGGADSDTLEVGAGSGPLDFVLSSTANTGLTGYSSFENLDASAAGVGDDINVDAASGGSTITTGDGDDDITAGSGNDVIDAGLGDDIVRITAASYNAADTIDGGADTTDDTLVVTGGGTVDMNTGLIENIEIVEIDNSAVAANVFTANDDDLYIDVSGGDVGATINLGTGLQNVDIVGNGGDIVNLGSDTNIVNTGNGGDTVNNVDDGDTVNLEGGNDSTTYAAVTATVDAGEAGGEAGNGDTLTIAATTGIMSIDLSQTGANNQITSGGTGNWYNFESLAAGGASHALTVTASGVGGSITTGSAGDTVTLGAAGNDTVNTGGGSDTVTGGLAAGDTVELGAGNDTYTHDSTSTGGSVSGGADDADTLTLGVAGNTAATILLGNGANTTIGGVAYSNFDHLDAGASNDALTVTAAAAGSDITTGSAVDVIHLALNGAADTVDAGGSGDSVDGIDAGDNVSLGDDADFATFSAVTGATIGGGTGGTDSDTLIIDDTAVAMSIDLSVVGGQQVAGANSTWQDFENLDAGYLDVTGDLTVTLSTDTNTVTTGAGDDTVSGGLTVGDEIHTGAGDESFTFVEVVGGVTVDAGEGDEDDGGDTLTITSTSGAMTIDLSAVDAQQITVGTTGTWWNFENLLAGGASHSLNVTASSGGSTITTGSANDQIVLGAGADIVDAGDGNDGVSGLLTAGDDVTLGAGDDNFTYSFLVSGTTLDGDIGSDTLVYNLVQGFTINVDLTNTNHIITDDDGNYQNFENFNSQTSSDVIHLLSNAGAGVVTGSGADVITLAAGGESINTFTGNDTFHGTAATINNADNINGGGGALDTLNITGGGTINLATATVTNIEVINTDATLATHLTLNTMSVTVTMGTAGDTLILGVAGGTAIVTTGDGDDSVTLGGGQNFITTGNGSDTILGTLTSGDTIDLGGDNDTFAYSATIDSSNEIDGGAGVDTLTYGGSGALEIDFSITGDNIVTDNSTPGADDGLYGNFENLSAATATAALTVTAATTGSVITTGTVGDFVTLGGGTDMVSTGGGSDTVTGIVGGSDTVDLGAGTDSFTYQALTTGTVSGGADGDTLVVGAGASALTITLGEIGNTVTGYSNFDYLSAAAADSALTVTAAAGGGSITTGSGADDITLGVGNDTVLAGTGNDIIHATSLTLNVGDNINGEGDTTGDTLAITGGGTVSMAAATVTGIEIVTLADSVTFIANNTDALVIHGSAFADNITTGDATGSEQTVNAGAGHDDITLGAAGQVINGQDGNDLVRVNATTIASTITAGEGGEVTTGDELYVTGGGTVIMGAGVTEFEYASLAVATTFTANATAGLTITGSSGIDTITTGNAVQTVNAGAGADSITVTAASQTINGGDGDDTVNVNATTIGSTIAAGEAAETLGDTLNVTGGGTVVMGAAVTEFETVTLAVATTFTANDTAGLIITGSSGIDTITTGNAVQTVNAGAGADSITVTAASQIINGGDGDDTINVTATTIASTIAAGEGAETLGDTLNVTGGGTVTMGAGVTEFEKVTLAVATNFTANTEAGLLITGSAGADTITVGAASQVVDAGADNDVIVLNDTQFDADTVDIDGEGGTNTLRISNEASLGSGGFSLVVNVQTLELAYTGTNSQSAVLGANAQTAGIVTVNASVATGNVTVTDSTGTGALSITTGSGADTITLGTAASTVNSGTGSDTINVDAATIASTINAGVGDTDVLNVTGGGTAVMGAGVTNVETVTLAVATTFTANATASLTITGSSGIDTITTGNAVQTVNAGAGADSITVTAASQIINGGDGDDTINVTATTIASTIAAGEGVETLGDTLNVTGGGTVVMGAAVTEFENVTLATGTTFTANNTSGLIIYGSAGGNDTIFTGNVAQTVYADNNGGAAGNDTITLGAAGQSIYTEDGDDLVHSTGAFLIGSTIDGGAGANDTLDITSTSANMSLGSISNFEFVTLTAVGTNFIANGDTLTIDGSTGGDVIVLGAATQTVNAGDGNDIIDVTDARFDTNMTIDGGAHTLADVIRISDAASTVDDDFTNVDNIETLMLNISDGSAQSVTLEGAAELAGLSTVNAANAGSANGVTVDASAFDNALTIITGAGNDVVVLGSGINVVSTGAGSDDVTGALTADDTIDLGADNDIFIFEATVSASNIVDGSTGTDEIIYSGGAATFDFSTLLNNVAGQTGSYRNFENLDATAATGIITATAATTGSAIDTSTGDYADVITLGAGVDTVSTYDGSDTVNATGATLNNGLSPDDTIDAGVGDTDVLAITGGGTVVMGVTVTNFEQVTLATATTFTANDTANLVITGSGSGTDIITTGNAVQTVNAGSGNDTIIVGAVGQTIDAGNGNDTVVLSVAEAVGATSITGGNNSDTLEFSGGGIVDIGALGTITSFENISTGTTQLELTLTNTGFLVNVQGGGGVDHDITSGNNSGGDDTFKFDASNWADSAVIIDNFAEGSLNDVLDLSLLGIQTFWGEVATAGALVDSAFTGGGIEAVFAQDTDTLYVDFDGNGSFNGVNDLQILMAGVNDLTEATDLLI